MLRNRLRLCSVCDEWVLDAALDSESFILDRSRERACGSRAHGFGARSRAATNLGSRGYR